MKKVVLCLVWAMTLLCGVSVFAQDVPGVSVGERTGGLFVPANTADDTLNIPFINLNIREAESNQEVALSLQLLLLIAIITLSPSILILSTAFLRIAIVLDFIKRALSLQQVPPNQVLMGIALFVTLFVMWPTFTDIYTNSFEPFAQGEIDTGTMYSNFEAPLRIFMYKQMQSNPRTISLFMRLASLGKPANLSEVPTYVLIPAFVLNELTVAFKIGILLFVPFIVIDMVVASVLMSMGMIMLPPVMISMPFKLILFVLVDGWGLITEQVIRGFL